MPLEMSGDEIRMLLIHDSDGDGFGDDGYETEIIIPAGALNFKNHLGLTAQSDGMTTVRFQLAFHGDFASLVAGGSEAVIPAPRARDIRCSQEFFCAATKVHPKLGGKTTRPAAFAVYGSELAAGSDEGLDNDCDGVDDDCDGAESRLFHTVFEHVQQNAGGCCRQVTCVGCEKSNCCADHLCWF